MSAHWPIICNFFPTKIVRVFMQKKSSQTNNSLFKWVRTISKGPPPQAPVTPTNVSHLPPKPVVQSAKILLTLQSTIG
jgi:hypothetical protein